MKISIDIECTPAEARQFFGLPDLEPLHAEMMTQLKERMGKSLDFMDPEAFAKAWYPMGVQSMDQFQKFMQRMMQGAGSPKDEPRGGSSGSE